MSYIAALRTRRRRCVASVGKKFALVGGAAEATPQYAFCEVVYWWWGMAWLNSALGYVLGRRACVWSQAAAVQGLSRQTQHCGKGRKQAAQCAVEKVLINVTW